MTLIQYSMRMYKIFAYLINKETSKMGGTSICVKLKKKWWNKFMKLDAKLVAFLQDSNFGVIFSMGQKFTHNLLIFSKLTSNFTEFGPYSIINSKSGNSMLPRESRDLLGWASQTMYYMTLRGCTILFFLYYFQVLDKFLNSSFLVYKHL